MTNRDSNRSYDASRRRAAAAQTRERILHAAMRLHWEGVTEYGPLARAADCSVATVRKHFPSKEALFGSCTKAFAETLDMPDLDRLGTIPDPAVRLEQCVAELCRIHEAFFGYAWLCAQMREESPVLEAQMCAYEGLIDAMGGMLELAEAGRAGAVRGLLDYLTYRALRLAGGLEPIEVREALMNLLRPWIAKA